MITVAYQGSAGAYSQLAAQSRHPRARTLACADFGAVVAAVAAGRADTAVIPVRNSTIGEIASGAAALAGAASLQVVEEFDYPVVLCLLALPGSGLDILRSVESHPEALAQCRGFLARHDLVAEASGDTAESARRIALDRNFARGAVASEAAAERHGLRVLRRDIADLADNRTTFAVVARAARSAA